MNKPSDLLQTVVYSAGTGPDSRQTDDTLLHRSDLVQIGSMLDVQSYEIDMI